jgi:predicted esterase
MKHNGVRIRISMVGWFLVALCACLPAARAQVPTIRAEFPDAKSEVPITSWQLLGPFPFDKKELDAPDAERRPVGLNRDYLKDFGQDEATIDAEAFPLVKTPTTGLTLHRRFANAPISAQPVNNILELAAARMPMDYAVGYAAVVVETPVDRDIVIAVGADDQARIWLNHELLASDSNTGAHGLTKHRILAGAKLKKGSNFLLVKLGNLTEDWRLMVTLLPFERALELARDNAVNPILVSAVVPTGQPLRLRGDLLPATDHVQVEILNARHEPVDSAEVATGRVMAHTSGKLTANRLYYCRMTAGSVTEERPFYYGDLDAGYKRLSDKLARLQVSDETANIGLRAEFMRLNHLLLPSSQRSEFWDQKVATAFAQVENALALMETGADTFRRAPGTHLRGYRAAVDGQVQHYWIHIPEKALRSGKPMPIVIVLPYATGKHLPFLESYFLAAFDETERYRLLGDEFGFAVLQVWGRGNYMGGTAIGTADVFEALDSVRQDYPIDADRMYLLGYCEGGRIALLMAEHYPDRFAALSAEAPITNSGSQPGFLARWVRFSSPIAVIDHLVNTPVFISHDEADDSPPIRESAQFVERSKAVGVDATLVKVRGGLHGIYQDPMAEKRSLFEFFVGKRRAQQPRAVSPSEMVHGPIEAAFAAPVLVVEGSTGSAADRAVVHGLAEEMRSEWRKAYFVDCPTKKDSQVTEADIRKYNLVLIGDSATNSLIRRMGDRLPLRATATGVSVGGHDYPGERLGYEFIASNPLNPDRQVVVIGMNHWAEAKTWRLYPSRDGVCDYFVFDLQGEVPRLRDGGYFE